VQKLYTAVIQVVLLPRCLLITGNKLSKYQNQEKVVPADLIVLNNM